MLRGFDSSFAIARFVCAFRDARYIKLSSVCTIVRFDGPLQILRESRKNVSNCCLPAPSRFASRTFSSSSTDFLDNPLAQDGSFGLNHIFLHSRITLNDRGTSFALRLTRIISRIRVFKSVPIKWCSLAYIYATAVSSNPSANCFQPFNVVLKFSPTFKHQIRFRRNTSRSSINCSSYTPSSKFCKYSASIFVFSFSASSTASITTGLAVLGTYRFNLKTLPPASHASVLSRRRAMKSTKAGDSRTFEPDSRRFARIAGRCRRTA
mmetsp:Transcript_7649/g.30691  ORF Transcript_7649/g.30691 Transcript_7649/m.30691 type:complete len:265 (+) Transcript_7649:162-956(+)